MNSRTSPLRKVLSVAATASLLAMSIASAVGPAVVSAAAGDCVQEKGSTTVYPALKAAQSDYQSAVIAQPAWPNAQKLGCTSEPGTEGSGGGKAALMAYYVSGSSTVTDIAASSSPLSGSTTPSETTNLLAFQIGGDAMVLAVNSTNPVTRISMAEVTAIYNNDLRDWSQLANPNGKSGSILARTRITLSGSRDDMNRLFKMDRGTGSPLACSSGFHGGENTVNFPNFPSAEHCEPALVSRLGLARLQTSEDEADAACTSADSIVYTSLANLNAWGPGSAGCTQPGAIAGSTLKALQLEGGTTSGSTCAYGTYPVTVPVCGGSPISPSTSTAAVGGTYPAKRQLFLVLPKVSVMASKFGTGNGTGWTDNLGLTKAADLVNYMSSTAGQTALGSVGFIQVSVPAKQPIPDADIDLNGGIGLTDIGQITGRWNSSNATKGWVRADVDNSGGVGLTDIGKITGQWGAQGFVAP